MPATAIRSFRNLILLAVAFVSLPAQQPGALQILVIGGEGSINNVKQRTAREPVVEVRDRNNRPVAGAIVLFEAPRGGPSGTFAGGGTSLQVTTDAQGRASGRGFQPNSIVGDLVLQITAAFQGATATAAIHMRNVGGGGTGVAKAGGHGKLIAILAVVGAAAVAGIVAGTRGGGGAGATTPPTVSVSAGAGTVGPHP
jgi:hypothetical protein